MWLINHLLQYQQITVGYLFDRLFLPHITSVMDGPLQMTTRSVVVLLVDFHNDIKFCYGEFYMNGSCRLERRYMIARLVVAIEDRFVDVGLK